MERVNYPEWRGGVIDATEDIDRVVEHVALGHDAIQIWVDPPDSRIHSIGPVTDDGKRVRSPLFEAISKADGRVFSAGYNPDRDQYVVSVVHEGDGRMVFDDA